MNKNILIGSSLVAVAILVLVSFTGVVGYQTTKSSTIAKASPLFAVRSSRAIDEESKDLTCDYVGKGNTFLIPRRDGKTSIINKLIGIIKNMDDSTYNRFVRRVSTRCNVDNKDVNEILQLIRNNPKNLKQNPTREEPLPSVITYCGGCPIITIGGEIGSCLLYLISMLISFIQDTLHRFTFYCC